MNTLNPLHSTPLLLPAHEARRQTDINKTTHAFTSMQREIREPIEHTNLKNCLASIERRIEAGKTSTTCATLSPAIRQAFISAGYKVTSVRKSDCELWECCFYDADKISW